MRLVAPGPSPRWLPPCLAGDPLHESVPKAQWGPGRPAAPLPSHPLPPSLCCKISFKGREPFSLPFKRSTYGLPAALQACKSLKNQDAERSTLPDPGQRAGPGSWGLGPGLPCPYAPGYGKAEVRALGVRVPKGRTGRLVYLSLLYLLIYLSAAAALRGVGHPGGRRIPRRGRGRGRGPPSHLDPLCPGSCLP